MKNFNKLIALVVLSFIFNDGISQDQGKNKFSIDYGNNTSVGKYAAVNGTKIYYEEYGKGEPLLLIHGNSGSIQSMGNQIDFFKDKYRVIVADNRGHGKSGLNTDSLTYNQITADWEALAVHLKLDSLSILGWSDGGIIGLKMGISSKCKIKKIVTMGANLQPDTSAVNVWAINEVFQTLEYINVKIEEEDTTRPWELGKQVISLLLYQPHITHNELSKINAKVMVMAGDKDIIKNQHTVEIFKHIPQAHLCIMPGQTHGAPAEDPVLFNSIVDNFLSNPYTRPDSDWTKRKK